MDHPHRDVTQVQELALHVPRSVGLLDEVPAGVVEEHAVVARVGLAEALPQRIHLVGARALGGRRLDHPPAGVVGVLVHPVVGGRAVGVEAEAPHRPGGGRQARELVARGAIGVGVGRRADGLGEAVAHRIVAVAVARARQHRRGEPIERVIAVGVGVRRVARLDNPRDAARGIERDVVGGGAERILELRAVTLGHWLRSGASEAQLTYQRTSTP